MVLLLNRCMGAAGRWLGRPSWPVRWVGVSDISIHTGRGNRGVDMSHDGCSRPGGYGVDIAGRWRVSSMSSRPGGYGVDIAGRWRVSSMSSLGPATRTPWRKVSPPCHVIPMSSARRLPLPSMRSGRIRGYGCLVSSRGCWYCRPSSDCFTNWIVKGRRKLRLGYGIAGVEPHMRPEC